jgi:hypothetical protein
MKLTVFLLMLAGLVALAYCVAIDQPAVESARDQKRPYFNDSDDDSDDDDTTDDEQTTPGLNQDSGRRGPHRHHGSHHRHHHRRPHHHRGKDGDNDGRRSYWKRFENMTEEERVTEYCRHIGSHGNETEHHRGRHHSRYMNGLTVEQRRQLNEAWQRKRREMTTCCAMEADKQLECSQKRRSDRLDRICRKEETICPFALKEGSDQTAIQSRVDRCCNVQGTAREECFSQLKQSMKREKKQRKFKRARA